jgi:hypothetical protein
MLSKCNKQCRKHGQNFICALKSNMPFTALNFMKPITAFHETHTAQWQYMNTRTYLTPDFTQTGPQIQKVHVKTHLFQSVGYDCHKLIFTELMFAWELVKNCYTQFLLICCRQTDKLMWSPHNYSFSYFTKNA